MNILVFSTDDFLAPAGGAETAFWEVARRNPQHHFTLICARLSNARPRTQTVENISIHRIGIGIPKIDGILLASLGSRLAGRLHAMTPFDRVWSIMASYGAFAAGRFRDHERVPFLLTLQEGKVLGGLIRRTRAYRNIFVRADGIHAISNYLRSWALNMGFRADLPSRVIPNGVDVMRFTERLPDQELERERAAFGWGPDSYVMVTTSRLVPKNGMSDLVSAVARLPERFKLVIHGYGPLERALRSQATRLKVIDRVRFMGHLPRERLPSALAASDMFVRPSLSEGLGTSFLEALAAGLVVVGTPVGGIVDFLHDGKTGFLARPGDPTDLARVIARAAAMDAWELNEVRANATEMIRSSYEWDDIAHRMDMFFGELTFSS